MNQINAIELKARLSNEHNLILIDVREEYEYEDENIGGQNIPMANVMDSLEKVDPKSDVIFCCKSGRRSQAVAQMVERKTLRENVYYLEGGIDAYFAEFK